MMEDFGYMDTRMYRKLQKLPTAAAAENYLTPIFGQWVKHNRAGEMGSASLPTKGGTNSRYKGEV